MQLLFLVQVRRYLCKVSSSDRNIRVLLNNLFNLPSLSLTLSLYLSLTLYLSLLILGEHNNTYLDKNSVPYSLIGFVVILMFLNKVSGQEYCCYILSTKHGFQPHCFTGKQVFLLLLSLF